MVVLFWSWPLSLFPSANCGLLAESGGRISEVDSREGDADFSVGWMVLGLFFFRSNLCTYLEFWLTLGAGLRGRRSGRRRRLLCRRNGLGTGLWSLKKKSISPMSNYLFIIFILPLPFMHLPIFESYFFVAFRLTLPAGLIGRQSGRRRRLLHRWNGLGTGLWSLNKISISPMGYI